MVFGDGAQHYWYCGNIWKCVVTCVLPESLMYNLIYVQLHLPLLKFEHLPGVTCYGLICTGIVFI